MEWNSEIIGALKRLWAEGNSASKTAEKLEVLFGIKFTRNAIIGKIHRLIDAGKMETRGDYKPRHDNRTAEKRNLPNPKKPKPPARMMPLDLIIPTIQKKKSSDPIAKPAARATVPPPVYGENVIVFPLRSSVTGPTTLENVRGCLYAIGVNVRHQHVFCNADKKEGSAYCEEHHAKCHLPTPKLNIKKATKWRPF